MKQPKAIIRPRRLRLTLVFLFCALAVSVGACRAAPSDTPANIPTPTLFGTLQTQAAHADDEWAGGERLTMMELEWRRYETRDGVFDAAYSASQRRALEKLRAIGFKVTLGLGTHYTPRWLADLPGARFVDQAGAQSKDVNFVFNQKTRRYLERYLRRIDADLGLKNFGAIRIDSGGNGEMLYPNDGNFWAFDNNAQNGPDRPADLPLCPSPGWKPGQDGLTPAQIRAWGDWYVRCLALTADWQMRTLDSLGFTGWYQILTPGSGVRPSRYEEDIRNRLQDGLFGVGAVWQKLYEFLPHKRRVVVYVSSVGDRSGGDDTTQPGDSQVALTDPIADHWSATRWQVRLAGEYGLPVGGENPGFRMPASLNSPYIDLSPSGMMAHALAQAKAGRLSVLLLGAFRTTVGRHGPLRPLRESHRCRERRSSLNFPPCRASSSAVTR